MFALEGFHLFKMCLCIRDNFFVKSYVYEHCLRRCLHRRRKILEDETTFRSVYMQKFQSVWLTEKKELKSKDNQLNDLPPFLFCLSLVLGSS